MSRSIKEIQQTILDAKATAVELSALEVLTTQEQTLNSANSTSKVAIWRLWVWVVAFGQYVLEQYWDAFKIEIEARIAQSLRHPGHQPGRAEARCAAEPQEALPLADQGRRGRDRGAEGQAAEVRDHHGALSGLPG